MSSEPSSSGAEVSVGTNGTPGNASREHEMIGSLGEALAGVNLGMNAVHHGNGFSFHSEHNSGAPFNLHAQSNNNGTDLGGWGFNAEASAQGFNGPNGGVGEESIKAQGDPSLNQGIDIFLSQSPSKMLGNDVFKISTNNLSGLEMPQEDRSSDPFRQQPIGQPSPSFGEIRPNQDTRQGRKADSPSNLTGTSTSSRSGSPYNNNDGVRTINAYHVYGNVNYVSNETPSKRTPSFAEDDRSGGYGMIQSVQSHGVMNDAASPYSLNNTGGGTNHAAFSSPYGGASFQGSPQKQSMTNPGQQQQQVLYMAVPTPDGRGQVLQPVHMVQLPGKPFAYVLPGQPGAIQTMQPAVSGMDTQQPIMVLPNVTMQQQPASTNEISNLVGGTIRNVSQGQGSGYPTSTPESNQYIETSISGIHGVDYNTNLGSGSPYGVHAMNASNAEHDPLSSLYNTPQRPPLDALLGQVRRLSRDQVGCRLVQQALDDEGAVAATLILNEGLPFWGEAMVDPFGNYLFQKILEKITLDERIMLVKSVGTRLVNASLNLHGTRSVQKIVELCAIDEESGQPQEKKDGESAADILTRSLAPAAARLCIDSHGNHVIQRILLKLGHKHARFVFDAVAESVSDVARHRHGCCVIQRCLDSPPCPARSHLVRRIVDKSLELMQDAYGNYVVQYVLDVCADEDVHAVCESVVGKVNLLAIQKFSSNVMEKCLERCTDRVKEHYLNELSDSERIRELMMDPFGNYVIQRALSVATHAQAVGLVEAMRPHLTTTQPGTPNGHRNGGVRNTAGGRRIMAKICRRFPNFNLNGIGTIDELYSQNKVHRNQHQSSPVAQPYGHLSPQGQHHLQHQQLQHQRYNVNLHAVNLNTHQFEQHQPYFDLGDTGYFQHAPHMGNMGNGAYPNGF